MEAKKEKKIYKYWLSKQDNKLHKEVVYTKLIDMGGQKKYTIWDRNRKTLENIDKEVFEKKMMQRTVAQAIYFVREDDALAKKHYIWAIGEKIKDAQEIVDKYTKIKNELSFK